MRHLLDENKNKPATKKQLWALFCATKIDHRDKGLTMGQAHEMLKEANENRPNKPSKHSNIVEAQILNYMKENVNEVTEKFNEVIGVRSVIESEVDPDDNPRYGFVGFGCGFAWVNYDKRSKVAKSLFDGKDSPFDRAVAKFRTWFESTIDKKVKRDLEKFGCPVSAIIYQDMDMNIAIKWLALDYCIKEYNLKKAWIDYRLD